VGIVIDNKLSDKTVLVGTWVSPDVKELCEKMAEVQGTSLSGYVRGLIISDLDKRTFFTTKVKAELDT